MENLFGRYRTGGGSKEAGAECDVLGRVGEAQDGLKEVQRPEG